MPFVENQVSRSAIGWTVSGQRPDTFRHQLDRLLFFVLGNTIPPAPAGNLLAFNP
jgi:hypothetical protein